MAESSSHKTSSLEITPKEELVTLEKPKSPNPFLPASQVDFTFDEITFTTNNEVAILYPSLPNHDYFEAVSDFISKWCLKEAFTRVLNQYKEYLSEVWCIAKTLDDSKPHFTDHMKAICNIDVLVDFKALKPSLQTKEIPQGKNPRVKSGHRRKQTLKHTYESTIEASKSQTGQSKKKLSPVQPRTKAQAIHYLLHQCFFHLHSKSSPRHDALADSTGEADPGISVPNDSIS
nr:hypothetical protein [Tanacetum cinerariifolium]